MSSESRPALSAIVLGITSSDLANMFITSCSLPEIQTAYYLSPLESSIYVAPPPATTLFVLKHRLTIIIASFKDLSAYLMNCSAPPLRIIVADLVYDLIVIVRLDIIQKGCIFQHRFVFIGSFHKSLKHQMSHYSQQFGEELQQILRLLSYPSLVLCQHKIFLYQQTIEWLNLRWAIQTKQCQLQFSEFFLIFSKLFAIKHQQCSGSLTHFIS